MTQVSRKEQSYEMGFQAGMEDWCVGYECPQVNTPQDARKLLEAINEFRRDVYGDPGYANPDGTPLEPIDIDGVDLAEFVRGYSDGFRAAPTLV